MKKTDKEKQIKLEIRKLELETKKLELKIKLESMKPRLSIKVIDSANKPSFLGYLPLTNNTKNTYES